MRRKKYTLNDFEKLIGKIVDHDTANITPSEVRGIVEVALKSNEPMFWLTCVVMGLKEGSTFIQGAESLKKKLGW